MIVNENIKSACALIKQRNEILIVSHINPDSDTLSSSLALRAALVKLGKKVDIFCDSEVRGRITSLSGVDVVNKKTVENYSLAIAVDSSDIGRIGKNSTFFLQRMTATIAIDHHESHKSFTNITILDKAAASTAEIMFDFLVELDSSLIDDNIASLLYTGIVCDSGCFAFSSVSSSTMRVASELLKYNVPKNDIAYNFFRKQDYNTFKLHSEVLADAVFSADKKIAYCIFKKEQFEKYNLTMSSTEGAINKLIDVDEVCVAISITEVSGNCFKCSVRTKDPFSANAICETFGGGGHKNAAGCQLNVGIFDVLDRILGAAKKELTF